jgi:hypothetical protein
MNTATDIPVTTTSEAEARIAELGMHKELEQMIAYVRKTVPGLTDIAVELAECYDTRDETGVSIFAYSDRVFESENSISWDLIRWAVDSFPSQVLEHLCILLSPGKPNAR